MPWGNFREQKEQLERGIEKQRVSPNKVWYKLGWSILEWLHREEDLTRWLPHDPLQGRAGLSARPIRPTGASISNIFSLRIIENGMLWLIAYIKATFFPINILKYLIFCLLFGFYFVISTVVLFWLYFFYFYIHINAQCIRVGCVGLWVIKWAQVPNDIIVGRRN